MKHLLLSLLALGCLSNLQAAQYESRKFYPSYAQYIKAVQIGNFDPHGQVSYIDSINPDGTKEWAAMDGYQLIVQNEELGSDSPLAKRVRQVRKNRATALENAQRSQYQY